MPALIHQLSDLGLNEKQARAYIALLELGRGTAYAVAKQAGLKRPTTYLVLDELRKRGLALKMPKAKNALFIAKSPLEFFAVEEERIRSARRWLPDLMARARQKDSMSQVLYFEGLEGIKEALRYRLSEQAHTEIVCFYGGTTKPLSEKTSRLYHDYYADLAAQATRTRAIAPQDPNIESFRQKDKLQYREVMTLPVNEYSGPVSLVEVAAGSVKIILHKDRQALVIENEKFATLLRQLFELIWKKVKK